MALRTWPSIELCAGVGGLGLGVSIAEPGHCGVCYVEREAFAAARLVSRMEAGELDAAPVWSDLTTFDPRQWRGRVRLVTSGDPCQPNSVAGNRLGVDDDRFLADHVVRVFDESGADRLFRENVTGNAGGQLAAFVPALEAMGCRVAVGIFRAREVGASHLRERLFLMADRSGAMANAQCAHQGRRGIQRSRESSGPARIGTAEKPVGGSFITALGDPASARRAAGQSREGWPIRDEGGRPESDGRSVGMGNTLHPGSQGLGPGNNPSGRQEPDGYAGLSGRARIFAPGPTDRAWLDIIRDAPSLEPAVCRMADGMVNRVDELRACGNGVVSLVAAYAWRTLDALLADAAAGDVAVKAAA